MDALFVPKQILQQAIAATAAKLDLPPQWMNDGVKGYLSEAAEMQALPFPEFTHLRLQAPCPEYLLAMKCMAARIPGYGTGGDREDVLFLLRHLGIQDADKVMEIVQHYYGTQPIHVKTKYFIEEIIQELS
ncbi:MAG: hypothetical protein HC904_06010 [Blastochloris sp.]|nr:hypothetical protein [Blastochloris sp.]